MEIQEIHPQHFAAKLWKHLLTPDKYKDFILERLDFVAIMEGPI